MISANSRTVFLLGSAALLMLILACAGSEPAHSASLALVTDAASNWDGGGCPWPAAATSASACEPVHNAPSSVLCPASAYNLICRNATPQASLRCWAPVIPGNTPSVVRYCCPCEGEGGAPAASQ